MKKILDIENCLKDVLFNKPNTSNLDLDFDNIDL